MRDQTADEATAHELYLYIENDGQLYRQMYQPQVMNMARRIVRGDFNPEKAVKLVVYLVEEGIRRYRKEFGLGTVNRATKEAAARMLLPYMTEQAQEKAREITASKKRARPGQPDPSHPGWRFLR